MTTPNEFFETNPSSPHLDPIDVVPLDASVMPVEKKPKRAQKAGISRRAFAAGAACAVGSLFLEPVIGKANTYWLPGGKERAQAFADGDRVSGVVQQIEVLESMFGVVCFDKETPLPSVEVKVKSFYNDEECADISETHGGVVYFNVSQVCRKKVSDYAGEYWESDAKITITPFDYEGKQYRQVILPRFHVTDQLAIQAPIIELERETWADGSLHVKPYFRFISFDDWDIQFNQQEFPLSPSNDIKHNFAAELYFPEDAKYSVCPIVTKSNTASRVGQAVSSAQVVEGKAGEFKTINFDSKQYLCTTSSDVLQAGDVITIVLSDPAKSGEAAKLYSVETGLSVYRSDWDDGPQDMDDDFPLAEGDSTSTQSTQSVSLSLAADGAEDGLVLLSSNPVPGMKKVSNPTITLPKDGLPVGLAGAEFSTWLPTLPLVFRYDPVGYLMFGVEIEFANWSNAPDAYTGDTSWRSCPRQSAISQIKRKYRTLQKSADKMSQMVKDLKAGKEIAQKMTKSWTLNVVFQFMAEMEYDKDKSKWEGSAGGDVAFTIGGTFTFPIVAFVYAQIGGSLRLAAGIEFELESEAENAGLDLVFSNLHFIRAEDFMLNFCIGFFVAVCVGVPYLANVGLRGSGGFSMALQFRDEKNAKGKKNPRFILGLSGELSIAVEFCLMKGNFPFLHGSWPKLVDTDDDAKSTSALDADGETLDAAYSFVQEGGAYYIPGTNPYEHDLKDGLDAEAFVAVTDAELKGVAEITVDTGMSTQSAEVPLGAEGDTQEVFEPLTISDFSHQKRTGLSDDIKRVTMVVPGVSADEDGNFSILNAGDNYDYSWTSGHDAQYNDRGSGDSPIYELGKEGGVRPRHMNLLAKDVFSASRSKLIELNGARYLFRIAPVIYDGNVLGRVVYQKITDEGVSKPFPVRFEVSKESGLSNITRDILYDYDFDVKISAKNDDVQRVLLLVVSGVRTNGDNTSVYEAIEATYASAVRLELRDDASTDETQGVFVTAGNITWGTPSFEDTGRYYAIHSPRLLPRSDISAAAFDKVIETDGFDHEFGFFLIDCADTKNALLSISKSGKISHTALNLVHFIFRDGKETILEFSEPVIPVGVTDVVPSSTQVAPSDPNNAVFTTFGYTALDGSGVDSIKITFEKSEQNGVNYMKSLQVVPVIDVDHYVKTMHPWDDANTLLASVCTNTVFEEADSENYIARTTIPSVEEMEKHLGETIGFAKFDLSYISPKGIPLGNLRLRLGSKYCYYPINHSGFTGYIYDKSGNQVPNVEDPTYQIMAIAQVDGVFTEPFVFAVCDTPIDSFFSVEESDNSSQGKVSFVTRSVTALSDSKADLYSFDVPFLRSISLDQVAPAPSEVTPGAATEFCIAITNTGNTVLTQAKLEFYDNETGEKIGEQVLNFKDATNASLSGLNADAYDTEKMSETAQQNMLVADNGNAALIPGQSRTFKVTIDIPESWAGSSEKVLRVNAASTSLSFVDPETGDVVDNSTSTTEFESESVNSTTVKLPIAGKTTVTTTGWEIPGDVVSYVSVDGSESGDSDAGAGSGMPKTGDTPLVGMAALALGAAGATVAAYSARRARLESESAQAATQDQLGDIEDTEEE